MTSVSTLPSSRTFVLGVGAQKAGTTWLHAHLHSSPECADGFMKEYHVWDPQDDPSLGHFRTQVLQQAREATVGMEDGQPADGDILRRAAFYADPEAYFDYFELLLSRPGIRIATDITPSYARMSAEQLAVVRDGFARRGIRVLPVFLMREPAERIWSAVRMYQRRSGQADRPSAERVLEVYNRPRFELRTRYEHTMTALEAVFGRHGVFYALYERLFDDTTVRELSAALGLTPQPADFERRVNASPKRDLQQLPDDAARRIAEYYRATYDAVAERLGHEEVAAAWPDQRWLAPQNAYPGGEGLGSCAGCPRGSGPGSTRSSSSACARRRTRTARC